MSYLTITDGLSEVAMYHPYEYEIFHSLYKNGMQRLIRGDHAFVNRSQVHNWDHLLSEIQMGKFGNVRLFRDLVNSSCYKTLCEASENVINGLLAECEDCDINEAKERVYFECRVQGYLNNAAYYKQVWLDHRNPLLDENILDMIEYIPLDMRVNRQLYRNTVHHRYQELAKIPYASQSNMEGWGRLLSTQSEVRDFAMSEISDTQSGIWEYFDRRGLESLIQKSRPRKSSAYRSIRKIARSFINAKSPQLISELRVRQNEQWPKAHRALLRVLALKKWYDNFVT